MSSVVFSADNILQLDPKRDSAPYKAPILAMLKKVEGFKWDNGEDGYIISQETGIKSNWDDETIINGIFVHVKRFYYGKLYEEYTGYARQSRFEGYVEIYDWNNRDKQLHIKSEDSNTIGVYYHVYSDEKKFYFKKVQEFFNKNPNGNERQKNAEETGLVF